MDEPTVLLVEDNQDDVFLIRLTLERVGVKNPIRVVSDAEQAMAYLKGEGEYRERAKHPLPEVTFVDLKLPGKSGHDLLQWMGEQPELRSIVRVVLTGSDDPADLKRSYALGANAYLRKPLTPEQLTGPGRNLRALLARDLPMAA